MKLKQLEDHLLQNRYALIYLEARATELLGPEKGFKGLARLVKYVNFRPFENAPFSGLNRTYEFVTFPKPDTLMVRFRPGSERRFLLTSVHDTSQKRAWTTEEYQIFFRKEGHDTEIEKVHFTSLPVLDRIQTIARMYERLKQPIVWDFIVKEKSKGATLLDLSEISFEFFRFPHGGVPYSPPLP